MVRAMRRRPADEDPDDDPRPAPLQEQAEVECPCCGEPSVLALDPSGGGEQELDHDCPVCCRPWRVRLAWDGEGRCDVRVEGA